MQKYFKISSFYLLFGLVMGIFSREFTKLNNFSGYTVLKSVHTHTLVLGFLFFIIVLLLEKNFTISDCLLIWHVAVLCPARRADQS